MRVCYPESNTKCSIVHSNVGFMVVTTLAKQVGAKPQLFSIFGDIMFKISVKFKDDTVSNFMFQTEYDSRQFFMFLFDSDIFKTIQDFSIIHKTKSINQWVFSYDADNHLCVDYINRTMWSCHE